MPGWRDTCTAASQVTPTSLAMTSMVVLRVVDVALADAMPLVAVVDCQSTYTTSSLAARAVKDKSTVAMLDVTAQTVFGAVGKAVGVALRVRLMWRVSHANTGFYCHRAVLGAGSK